MIDRIRCKGLENRVGDADAAAGMIHNGMTIGVSGHASSIAEALKERARLERDFKLVVWATGINMAFDKIVGGAGLIRRRIGQQTPLRRQINDGRVDYCEVSYKKSLQAMRDRASRPLFDLSIVSALCITEDGYLVPARAVGDGPEFALGAQKVIVRLATAYPLELEGMHDIFLPPSEFQTPCVSMSHVTDRIGTPFIPMDKDKIALIVMDDTTDETILEVGTLPPDISEPIAQHTVRFLKEEADNGRLPRNLLPIQTGMGQIPALILGKIAEAGFKELEFIAPMISDGHLDLIDQGRIRGITGTGITMSDMGQQRFLDGIAKYKNFIVLRPLAMFVAPELSRLFGLITLNGAVEVDLYGHVNSTHLPGGNVVNGIGGLNDYSQNAYLSMIALPSIALNGKVSSIVPMVSHVDLTEHMVDVLVTEQGIADLRWLTPVERAREIIQNCSHPRYRPLLKDYLDRAIKYGGHEPQLLREAFSFLREI